jgi:hypothetical protein
VDRAGRDLLAGAGLAQEQHAGAGARDLVDRRDHRRHRGIAVGERRQPVVDRGPGVEQAAPLEGPLDHQAQLVGSAQGLLQVVEGAELHGLDRGVDRAVGGHHDHLDLGLLGLELADQGQAVEVRHLQVGDEQVEAALVEPSGRDPTVLGLDDVVAL